MSVLNITPLRYRPRIRRVLLKLSNHVLEERICNFLYPDDCTIRFHEYSPEYWEQKALETLSFKDEKDSQKYVDDRAFSQLIMDPSWKTPFNILFEIIALVFFYPWLIVTGNVNDDPVD